jgi:N-terminal half of MaoC dehydratase
MSVPGLEHLPGTELPAGTFTITAEEDARVLEVVGGEPSGDGSAHPLWAYIAPQRGIGISVAEICRLADFDVADGPMLGSSELELHAPIRLGQEYTVTGRVLSIDRKHGSIGTFDLMAFREDLLDADGNLVAASTSTYVLPRREA